MGFCSRLTFVLLTLAGLAGCAVTGIPDDRDRHPIGDAIGRLAFAGEHTAPRDWTATIEGAIRSGQRAAEDILNTLGDAQ